ncbi:hypothetical protein D3C76_1320510 [compost metagenome]
MVVKLGKYSAKHCMRPCSHDEQLACLGGFDCQWRANTAGIHEFCVRPILEASPGCHDGGAEEQSLYQYLGARAAESGLVWGLSLSD